MSYGIHFANYFQFYVALFGGQVNLLVLGSSPSNVHTTSVISCILPALSSCWFQASSDLCWPHCFGSVVFILAVCIIRVVHILGSRDSPFVKDARASLVVSFCSSLSSELYSRMDKTNASYSLDFNALLYLHALPDLWHLCIFQLKFLSICLLLYYSFQIWSGHHIMCGTFIPL